MASSGNINTGKFFCAVISTYLRWNQSQQVSIEMIKHHSNREQTLDFTSTCGEQLFSRTKSKVSAYEQLILASSPGKSLRRFRNDNNDLEKSDACILNFCKWQKNPSEDNALQH